MFQWAINTCNVGTNVLCSEGSYFFLQRLPLLIKKDTIGENMRVKFYSLQPNVYICGN